MKEYNYRLNGQPVRIHYPEHADELGAFHEWIQARAGRGSGLLGLDTETTGLQIFGPDFKVRTVQFGDTRQAWVLRVDMFGWAIRRALQKSGLRFVLHNAPFDTLAIERTLGLTLEGTLDTRILAHLLDPRAKGDGDGIGHSLKALAQRYVAPEATDGQSELIAEFRKIKKTKDTGWAAIDIDNPAYVTYAGLDPILTLRLYDALIPQFAGEARLTQLIKFEHELSTVCTGMVRRGLLIDVPYTERLSAELKAEQEHYAEVAAGWGVANVNSTRQVAAALINWGIDLPEKTATGQPKVDKSVLLAAAELTSDLEPLHNEARGNKLADAVLRSKRAGKWNEAYVGAFLNQRDAQDRIHPSINTLAARTGRMSISGIPLQQLPSKEWRIRRSVVADPGKKIISCDYSQIELVMLAALSGDEAMLVAARAGTDMHDFAASRVYGPDFTKKQRSVSKAVSLGRVYGGGAATIQRQTGAPMAGVREAIAAYDREFPGVKAFGARLQDQLDRGIPLTSVTGRRLPVDEGYGFRAVNYVCQSAARDVLASAILDMSKAGLDAAMLLPVHDELIMQAPAAEAAEMAREVQKIMTRTLGGNAGMAEVTFRAEAEVGGRSWGSLYGAPEEQVAA